MDRVNRRYLQSLPRDRLTEIAQLAWEIEDDPDVSDSLKRLAHRTNIALTEILVYGPENVYLQPITFGPFFERFYAAMVEEMLLDIGEGVCAQQPTRVVAARQAAKAVDHQGYGTDYRLDMLESLNRVLASLVEYKDEFDGRPMEVPTLEQMVHRLERRYE